MAGIVIVVIILGCGLNQYFKGTLVKGFVSLIVAFSASIIAFGYFEALAGLLIGEPESPRLGAVAPWGLTISFVLLFAVSFGLLQTIAAQLIPQKLQLPQIAEKAGRVIAGFFLGLFVSGLLITALDISPLPSGYPYPRYQQNNPEPRNPSKVFLNADGFASGFFSLVSKGSMSAEQSFAVLHADFPGQAFLNRLAPEAKLLTGPDIIQVPSKAALWYAPEGLKDAAGNEVQAKAGERIMVARVGLRSAQKFTLSQLRFLCKKKGQMSNPLKGKATPIYPGGYIAEQSRVKEIDLGEVIEVRPGDFSEGLLWFDFVFAVPEEMIPSLVQFKQSITIQLPGPVSGEQVPELKPFPPVPEAQEDAEPQSE